ncbi:hypothetical protein R3Q06_11420 [Rhodococcus erythropolis]|uniref:hypothetical protein n=1 Tax=Rhodococcus erythropolis TaxID=1833 RepID=UPI00294997F7|nr:hypothetical protein [Rhodococcus erythropolis]MDV6274110.1 hypothetical protein [Rhodococcus erythropolis]
MAVTAKLYGLALKSAFNKEIDWDTDTIKVMLCTSAYTPDQDTHQYKSSVTNEASGTGYTAGGATLASATLAYTTGTNTLVLDAVDSAWTGSTITARYAVIYNSSPGTDATRPLIAYVDFGADVSTTAGTFTITWDAAGIVTVTAA